MFFSTSLKNNAELIDSLIRKNIIKKKNVEQVMRSIDRADFCNKTVAYEDRPQGIGYNVTISAPHMHAYALELLEDRIQNAKRCLDVGSGSGYLTLAFQKLMKDPNGISVGVEHIGELCEQSKKNIAKNHKQWLDSQKVVIVEGDGRAGYQKLAPYDVIHVGAGASTLPQELIDQLALGGRLVLPLGPQGNQCFTAIDKDKNGQISKQQIMGVSYVPLTSKQQQLGKYF